MMLGVVYHSAYVYIPESHFLVFSDSPVIGAKFIADTIHAFRMPAFFVVSGFFCVLTLSKYGWQKFLRVRIVRLLVPLIVTAVTLNSLMTILLANYGMTDRTILAANYGMTEFTLRNYLLEGGWVFHLWFLVNLIVYFLFAALLASFAARSMAKIGRQIGRWILAFPILIVLLLLPFMTIAIYASKRVGLPLESDWLGIFSVNLLILHAPYFIFGAVLASDDKLLPKFSGLSPLISVPMIVLVHWVRGVAERLDHFAETIATVYCNSLIAWLAIAICFYVFRTFFNRQTNVWLFLSDASYTVYLFHMLFVAGFGIILIRFDVYGPVALSLLMVATASVTLAIHAFVIRKNRVARFLYNGK